MQRTRAKVAAVLMAGLVLAAGACGGSKKDESSTGDAVKGTVETTTTTAASKTKSTDMSDALDQLGGSGDCLQAAGAYATIGLSILTYMGGATPAQIAELQSQVDDLKGEIPSEIRDDFQVFADGIAEYASAMQGVDMSNILDSDVQDQMQKASDALDSPEMTKAQANIDAYFSENCS